MQQLLQQLAENLRSGLVAIGQASFAPANYCFANTEGQLSSVICAACHRLLDSDKTWSHVVTYWRRAPGCLQQEELDYVNWFNTRSPFKGIVWADPACGTIIPLNTPLNWYLGACQFARLSTSEFRSSWLASLAIRAANPKIHPLVALATSIGLDLRYEDGEVIRWRRRDTWSVTGVLNSPH